MEFQEMMTRMMEQALAYSKRHDLTIDKEFAAIKLFEEAGEFAQALLIHERKSRAEKFLDPTQSKELLAKELADVLGYVVVNAKLHDLDLEQAIRVKWLKEQ